MSVLLARVVVQLRLVWMLMLLALMVMLLMALLGPSWAVAVSFPRAFSARLALTLLWLDLGPCLLVVVVVLAFDPLLLLLMSSSSFSLLLLVQV